MSKLEAVEYGAVIHKLSFTGRKLQANHSRTHFIPIAKLINQNGNQGSRNVTHSNVERPYEGGS